MSNLNLTQAHDQWSSRPDDERFWTLEEMHNQTLAYCLNSEEVEMEASDCKLFETDRGISMRTGTGPDDSAEVSHYAFTQVCRQLGAPPSYLRQLPNRLVVDCLETARTSMGHDDRSRSLLLDMTYSDRPLLRATTSSRYVRVWNHRLVEQLMGLKSEGWIVPPARPSGNTESERTRIATDADCVDFGASPLTVKPGDEIAPAGLYASNHDMFAFMIHPDIVIENGLSPAGMRRGTMIRQSEVGACSIWKLDFLFDTVCGNHIVWNAKDVKETRVIHKGNSVEDNWLAMVSSITEEAQMSASDQEADIRRAQELVIAKGKDAMIELLFKKRWTSKRDAASAYDLAAENRHAHGNPDSAWGIVSGLTLLSQKSGHADGRAKMDQAAGKILATCLN